MKSKEILNENQIMLIVHRISRQLIENNGDFSSSVIIGLQPRGVWFANRLKKEGKTIKLY